MSLGVICAKELPYYLCVCGGGLNPTTSKRAPPQRLDFSHQEIQCPMDGWRRGLGVLGCWGAGGTSKAVRICLDSHPEGLGADSFLLTCLF